MSVRIVVTGGGTGGHTTPLVAVGQALKSRRVEVVAIAEKKPLREPVEDFRTYYVSAGKIRRYNTLGWRQVLQVKTVFANIRDTFKVVVGFVESVWLLRRLRPDAIFIKGGYVSLPVGFAARLLSIPYVTHDSDVLPGLTNRLLARGAERNLTGFPVRNYDYDRSKTMQTGVPIRSLYGDITKQQARKKLGISATSHHIAIIGGSSGAQVVNEAVLRVADKLSSLAYVTHQTGKVDYRLVKDRVAVKKIKRYAVYDFIKGRDYFEHLVSADVVITRAGATALTELSALKKASIVVPNPFLTGGHQLKNANVLQSHDAARIMHQATLSHDPNLLVVYIDELLASQKERQWLGTNLHQVFKHNAAETVADVLMDIADETST